MSQEVVVITGASAGIGRATARKFAASHACIGLLARGKEGLAGTVRDVEALGGAAIAIPTDVANYEEVESAAAKIEETFGPIDIWINDAMTSIFSPFHEITPQEYKRVTEVTYLGTVYGTMAAYKRMRARDRGVIVQVGSALAYRGIPLQSAYCGAKHAVQGFMDSLRCELLHDRSKVVVTMVQMPGVNTPQFEWVKSRLHGKPKPLGAVYQPEVAAEAVYWAARNKRREIYVGYPTVEAIVGNKVVPGFADRRLAKIGFERQQRPEPDDPSRPTNLWEPVHRDYGAHGPFDKEASNFSPLLWATTHRKPIAAVGLAVIGLLAAAMGRKKKNG
jgi:short-subunit dehydrogenase